MNLSTDALNLPASELARLDASFPARDVAVGGGAAVSVRECGQGPAIVCLHGIGSGAASWIDTAALLASQARVIAWDAPGYGSSTPLEADAPAAADYAARLGALLDALEIDSCVLVGHSLGAITAASAARGDARILRLVLVSPAIGYGAASRAEARAKVRTERLATLDELGIAGMAAKRSGRLVSDKASEHARQWVRWNMARLNDHGYRRPSNCCATPTCWPTCRRPCRCAWPAARSTWSRPRRPAKKWRASAECGSNWWTMRATPAMWSNRRPSRSC